MAKRNVQLVVKSAIKEVASGMNVSHDVSEALNRKVQREIDDAMRRAKSNGRRTLQARDF